MSQRDLYAELMDGIEAMGLHREEKITLKTSTLKILPSISINSDDIINIRKKLNISRSVFANLLRISSRTLENWEQGRSKLPDNVATLIKLVDKYPDTLDRLQTL
jgi:putative transcriptional regulator